MLLFICNVVYNKVKIKNKDQFQEIYQASEGNTDIPRVLELLESI